MFWTHSSIVNPTLLFNRIACELLPPNVSFFHDFTIRKTNKTFLGLLLKSKVESMSSLPESSRFIVDGNYIIRDKRPGQWSQHRMLCAKPVFLILWNIFGLTLWLSLMGIWVSSPPKKKLNRRDEHLRQYQEISCLMRKWKQWQHKRYSWQMDWTKWNWLQCFQTSFPFVAFKCSEMRLMLTG